MTDLIQANWPFLLVALLIGIGVAWYIFVASRRTRVKTTSTDTLDKDSGPAKRNQALIDAPPAASLVTSAPANSPSPEPEPAASPDLSAKASPSEQPARTSSGASSGTSSNSQDKGKDDLTRIKGVGPKLAEMLNQLGIHTFREIAGWSDADIDRIDAQLGRFQGRIQRDSWVEQAQLLAQGDLAAYESRFGKQ
ncbi:MAG: hypothetical protein ACK5NN_10580 [Sphingomonadaceae bacterium]